MTNARDGTVPATLATQRIALRVAPRKRRVVERQRRQQATGRLAFDEARGVVALELPSESGPTLGHASPILSHLGALGVAIPNQNHQLAS